MLREIFGRLYRSFVPFAAENDEINAEQERALKAHSKVADKLKVAASRRLETNASLRTSLHEARVKAFEDFEDLLKEDHKHRKGKMNGHGH